MNDVRATNRGTAGASRWFQCNVNSDPFAVPDENLDPFAEDDPLQEPSTFPPMLLSVHAARYGYHYLEELAFRVYGLTELERRIGHCLLMALTYEQTASAMNLSVSSIKGYTRSIFKKVAVKDRHGFESHIRRLIEHL